MSSELLLWNKNGTFFRWEPGSLECEALKKIFIIKLYFW